MRPIKEFRYKKKFIFILLIFFSCGLLFLYSDVTYKKESWKFSDIYGRWKVVRVIYQAKGGYGESPLGNEIGRSFDISENIIKDSKSYDEAMLEKQICYNMDVLYCEENEFDVSNGHVMRDFQIRNNIILSYAGITDTIILEYTFYAKADNIKDNGLYYALEMTVFPYQTGNKDLLVMHFPYGSYILQRYKKQEKIEDLQGNWMVEELVSRGRSEETGIDFIKMYGKVYEVSNDKLIYEGNTQEISYTKKIVKTEEFEQANFINEGLGIENEKIEVFHMKINDEYETDMIPINNNEMIVKIDEQWFCLKRIKEYTGSTIPVDNILRGEWKPTLLMAIEDVNENLEANTYNSPLWWYGNQVILDKEVYVVDVSEWSINKISVSDMQKMYDIPQNVLDMFNKSDVLQIAVRIVNQVEEIYIILDDNSMIRGRNGLWFRLEKIS